MIACRVTHRRMTVSRNCEFVIQRGAAFFVIQVNEFSQQAQKHLLLIRIQRLQQAKTQQATGWKQFFQKRGAFGSEMQQAKALALCGDQPPDEPALLEANRKIGGSGSIEGTEARQRNLVDTWMVLKYSQNGILNRRDLIADRRVEHRNRNLLGAADQMAGLVVDIVR